MVPTTSDDPIVKFNSPTIKAKSKDPAKSFVWNTTPFRGPDRSSRNIISNINPGPKGVAMLAKTPGECFSSFIDDKIIDEIVEWTNQKILIENAKYKKLVSTIKETTSEEIKALLGILIFSGFRKDNHLSTKDVWSAACGANFYRASMSESRFNFLINNLRFDDFATRDMRKKNDKLAPIKLLGISL